jgi:cation diffusion facilitator CzcD-associated flavoprotein CzcO
VPIGQKTLDILERKLRLLGTALLVFRLSPLCNLVRNRFYQVSCSILICTVPDVKELINFIRSPTWITPPSYKTWKTGKVAEILQNLEMDGDDFTPKQIEKFKSSPEYYLEFVKAVEEQINGRFPMVSSRKSPSRVPRRVATIANHLNIQMLKDSETQAQAFKILSMYMSTLLGNDPRLCKALIPTFPVGCRRLTPGPGYLESLTKENVRVVTDNIVKIVPKGLELTTGEIIEVDALICATGFDLSFRPRFPLIGRKGNLQDLWTENLPRAYMSCAVPDFPNYFSKLIFSLLLKIGIGKGT